MTIRALALAALIAGVCRAVFACPPGTLQGIRPTECYRVHRSVSANWTAAEAVCQADGGHLPSVTNAAANRLLLNVSANTAGATYIWLGASSTDGQAWNWSDGARWRYTSWATGRLFRQKDLLAQLCLIPYVRKTDAIGAQFALI